tara:strand:- start:920 stop:3007 length:2088 start_codon:yes stop_codon:yes gene_type:complete
MRRNRKGQVTLFVVIGILLVVGALVIFTVSDVTESRDLQQNIVDVPVEFQPIKNFVDNCIIRVATEGLERIGFQGGYIDPLAAGLKLGVESTSSEVVEHPPGSKSFVPYWWFMESSNDCEGNCVFTSKRPALYREDGDPSIESELDNFVNDNLKDCLEDFSALAESGIKVNELGDIKTTTTVTDSNVNVKVDYPLEIIQESSTKIDEFLVVIPLNLKRIYEQATSLTNLQIDQHYLEKVVRNLIVAFSDVDETKLPPTSDMEFKFGSTVHWLHSTVKKQIEGTLGIYTQAIQVFNSKNYKEVSIPGEPRREAWYNKGMLVPASPDVENVNVYYNYLDWWDFYFDLNCGGEVCIPESIGTDLLPVVGIQRYKFQYDISHPVLVEIDDPDALNDRGYKFQFMLESNIRNNQPMTSEFVQLEGLEVRQNSQLCDFNKRNSGNISIKVVEQGTTIGVDGVQVVFTAGRESCFIGETDFNGSLVEKFPVSGGAHISFLHPEYLKRTEFIFPKYEVDDAVFTQLQKETDIDIEVKKFALIKENGFWNIKQQEQEIGEDENVNLIFTRIGLENDGAYSVIGDYRAGEESQLRLYPGLYELQANLISDKDFAFSKEICTKPGFFDCEEKENFEISFNDSMVMGGALLNVTITPDMLTQDTITFYVLQPDFEQTSEDELGLEDLDIFTQIDTYTTIYLSALQPK